MALRKSLAIAGRELSLSNPDKILFPKSGTTKGQVLQYYAAVSRVLLPHLHDRLLTLLRYPDGYGGTSFYEKNAPSHTPEWIQTHAVPRSDGTGDIRYILCNDAATLLWVTNLGDLEKHVLLSRVPDLQRPTSLVFDLDPGEPAGLVECCRVALALKKMFDRWGLQSFVKVSGSKGLHLNVPLNTRVTYETTRPFAGAIAGLAQRQNPELVVSDMSKALRKGKVLIDWSQNSDFKTTVAVYAMRAKHPEPFISMPLKWEEVERALRKQNPDPLFFTPTQALRRIERLGDLFVPVLTLQQDLPPAFTKAIAADPPAALPGTPKSRTRSSYRAAPGDTSLKAYAAKRNPQNTPEPMASPDSSGHNGEKGPYRYVIQKHAASHLHYDWRLEMQGVLRSWAVPKGPPFELRETRLAMHVEDHPLEYGNFEGIIPAGNYGAGTVLLWDEGTYEDLTGNPAAAYHAGKMHLILHGKKLSGEWILVRHRRGEDQKRWLLIKAGKSMKPPGPRLAGQSVRSGRTMEQIAEDKDAQWQSNRPAHSLQDAGITPSPPKPSSARAPGKSPAPARTTKARQTRKAAPAYLEAMQCRPAAKLPAGPGWWYEIKYDGYRALALKHGPKVELLSRNGKPLHDRFSALLPALQSLPGDWALDGEVVALDAAGKPTFQGLQNLHSREGTLRFYVFDCLHSPEGSLIQETLQSRRATLEQLMEQAQEPLRISPLLPGEPQDILTAVRQMGLEGVIAKKQDSLYEPGTRSGAWVKLRTGNQQEFVIGGYVPGTHGFSMLLVGVHDGPKLLYAAKVKSGFVARLKSQLFPELQRLSQEKCPFANLPETSPGGRWGEALTAEKMKECRWVKPSLVCQVSFVEWTDSGKLRHPVFLGLRDDKKASAVFRET